MNKYSLEVEQIWNQFDVDKNKFLEGAEAQALIDRLIMKYKLSIKDRSKLAKLIDKDGDRRVTKSELVAFFKELNL